jgi:hypothetical protein
MQREAKRAARRTGIPLRVVEIGGDAEMERLYGTAVPVLVIPGGETLQGRCGPGEVDGAFRRAAGTLPPRSLPSPTPEQATRRRGTLVGGFLSIVGWRRRPQA